MFSIRSNQNIQLPYDLSKSSSHSSEQFPSEINLVGQSRNSFSAPQSLKNATKTIKNTEKEQLHQVWELWATQGNQEEQRAEAIYLLTQCEENQSTELDLSGLKLCELPLLPSRITVLYCNHNKLTGLPKQLPLGLKELHCSDNQLTDLPELPQLNVFYADNNQLTIALTQLHSLIKQPIDLSVENNYFTEETSQFIQQLIQPSNYQGFHFTLGTIAR